MSIPVDLRRPGDPPEPDHRPNVPDGTLVVYSDLSCAFAHVCVTRLLHARAAAGLEDVVRIEHRPFVLEEINGFPIPKHFLDSEVPQIAPIELSAGWQVWQGRSAHWPVSTLLPMEAVQAAARQSPHAHVALDRALRLALFRDSRCITMRHVVLDVAAGCSELDVERLAADLDAGVAREPLMAMFAEARRFVPGSPHVLVADGTSVHNPGVQVTFHGEQGRGYPEITGDDPSACEALVRRAAATVGQTAAQPFAGANPASPFA